MRQLGEYRDGIAGCDLAGWHDFVVRNWRLGAEGDAEPQPNGVTIDAGPLSCTVLVGPEGSRERVAGPGARLAPHGRGDGWGDRGAAHFRRALRHGFEPDDVVLTLRGLAPRPAIAVLAIPDDGTMDDDARESRLSALRRAGARRGFLAWSSVLICLSHLDTDPMELGAKVGIFEIGGDRLRLQTLEIRQRDGVPIPRRNSEGRVWADPITLGVREQRAREAVLATVQQPRLANVIERVDLPALLAMDSPGVARKELVRLGNGDWVEIEGRAPNLHGFDTSAVLTGDFDLLLVHGPGEGGLTDAVTTALSDVAACPVRAMPPDAVARGAFVAGTRLRDGLPLWFDFLPQIDTIVSDGGEAESMPLIPEDADIEAGRVWRSSAPLRMHWPGASEELRVWLRKEGEDRPRLAPARAGVAPATTTDVMLYVEQAPAQDRAKLTITAPDWAPLRDNPAVVEWARAEPDPRDWETIIEEESGTRPSIPDRVVLPGDARMWGEDGADLSAALKAFDGKNFTRIYKCLANRKALDWEDSDPLVAATKYYCVDSDGSRPGGVTDTDWRRLGDVLSVAEERLISGAVVNNHTFGVLSWAFRLCPDTVWPIAIRVLQDAENPMRFKGHHQMYPQGLGRIAGTKDALRAAIDYLDRLPIWNMPQQACASFLLSRNDGVFDCMTNALVGRWAERVEALLGGQQSDMSGQRYRYLPTLIAGLLRWRRIESHALVLGHDPRADGIVTRLEEVIVRGKRPAVARHVEGYSELRPYFDDEGGNPDILQRLFDRT